MIREALAAADDPNARRVAGAAGAGGGRGARHRVAAAGDRVGAASLAAHRRQLHDPVRRGRRSAHRPRLPARRLRGRPARVQGGQQLRADLGAEQLAVESPGRSRHPRASTAACSATSARSASCWAAPRSASSCPRWPGTSPSRSPTGRASCPASSSARSRVTIGAGFLGGLVGGILAGLVALLDQPLEAADRRPGTQPVVDHPAAWPRLISSGLMVDGARPAAGEGPHGAGQLAEQPDRHRRRSCSASCSA